MKLHLLLAAALLAGAPSRAATLLNVGGPQDQDYTISPGTAAAVAFTIGEAAQDVSISTPIVCLQCMGGVYLNKERIGPTATLSNTVLADPFNSGVAQSPFSLGNLDAGTYLFIVSINAASSASAYWVGSSNLTVTSMGASRGVDFTADSLAAFVPLSDFQVKFGLGLNYSVSAEETHDIPEPPAWLSMVAGLGILSVFGRYSGTSDNTKSAT